MDMKKPRQKPFDALKQFFFESSGPPFKGERHEIFMGKIKKKLPMQKMVLTEEGEVWEYSIAATGKVIFQYAFTCYIEYEFQPRE
jgi:hypothetical protein